MAVRPAGRAEAVVRADGGPAAVLRGRVITVSDEAAAGRDPDRGGLLAVDLLTQAGVVVDRVVVPDDPDLIRQAIEAAVGDGVRVVLTCGGTGIGPSDHTADVVAGLVSFQIPGIAEEIRRRGAEQTPLALVSRQVAGAILRPGRPAVFVLASAGSRGGVRDALAVVGGLLGYLIEQLDGAGHT